MDKKYEGSCYIGVVGSEIEIAECRDSIDNIKRRNGDVGPVRFRGTKGYESRQQHFNNWLNKTSCEFIFLVDSDMTFEPDTLEKLRSHGLPFVSGTYMRRRYAPPMPVWFDVPENDRFVYLPSTKKLEKGKLYEIGASGWGCMLIHRDVTEAMKPILKGEDFVIEDDMDVYPYDLPRIMVALSFLDTMSQKENVPATALREYIQVLTQEIRPLRGVKDPCGSDVRFPYYARMAGFPLYLDTGVICGHMVNYPITVDDYLATEESVILEMNNQINAVSQNEIKKLEAVKEILQVARVNQ